MHACDVRWSGVHSLPTNAKGSPSGVQRFAGATLLSFLASLQRSTPARAGRFPPQALCTHAHASTTHAVIPPLSHAFLPFSNVADWFPVFFFSRSTGEHCFLPTHSLSARPPPLPLSHRAHRKRSGLNEKNDANTGSASRSTLPTARPHTKKEAL